MSAGTISLVNNSVTVTGVGTKFSTDLKVGDFIATVIGGVTYSLAVIAIASDTSLTLSKAHTGPTASGQAWSAIPQSALVAITMQLATDTAYAMRAVVSEKENWYKLLTLNQTVTITLPDGSSFTGPSWPKLVSIMGTLDMAALQPLVTQINNDKNTVLQAKTDTLTAKTAAETARTGAEAAEDGAQAAQTAAEAAKTAAQTAQSGAETAKQDAATSATNAAASASAADQAKQFVQGADPTKAWVLRAQFYSGDLNNLTQPGVWSVTTPITNGPTGSVAGVCEVLERLNSTGVIQRYTNIATGAAAINRTWQRTLSGTTWSAWELLGTKALNDLGVGTNTFTVMSSFDWQQMDFYTAANHLVIFSSMTNTPPGISYTAGTYVWVRVVGSNGQSISVELIASTSVDGNYKIYEVLIGGTKGARTFSVRQLFTSADAVPVANGGTGATTPAGARTALELGNSATRNVGTTAGTVAAGDDSRLNTVSGKTGGTILSGISVLGPVTATIDHGASLGNKQTHTLSTSMTTGATIRCQTILYALMDTYLARKAIWGVTSDNGSDQKSVIFNWTDGSLNVPGQVYPGSDIRHKSNIREVQNALEAVCNVRGVIYDKKDGGTEVGLIAQEVEQYCPEAIHESEHKFFDDTVITDFKSLNVSGFSAAFAFAAIKELKAEVDELREQVAVHHVALQLVEENGQQQKQIDSLESEVATLKGMVEALAAKLSGNDTEA